MNKLLDIFIVLCGSFLFSSVITNATDNKYINLAFLFIGIIFTIFGVCEYIIDSIKGNTDDK